MKCIACSEPLREGARFCRKCGARQPQPEQQSAQPVEVDASEGLAPHMGAPDEEAPDTETSRSLADLPTEAPARRARPARVPRTSSANEDVDAEESGAEPAPPRRSLATLPIPPEANSLVNAWAAREALAEVDTVASPAVFGDHTEQAASTHESAPVAAIPSVAPDVSAIPGTQDAPGASGPLTATPTPAATSQAGDASAPSEPVPNNEAGLFDTHPETPALTESEEVALGEVSKPDHGAPLMAKPSGDTTPADGSAGTTMEDAPDTEANDEVAITDSLPWPLVPGLIVHGRYRVEEVLSAKRPRYAVENQYRVTDLRGYERCWSCGTTHGKEASDERFCSRCGADLLAFPLLLSERLVMPGDAPSAPDTNHDTNRADMTTAASAPPDADSRLTYRYPDTFTQGQRNYTVTPLHEPEVIFPRGVHLTGAAATDLGAAQTGRANEDSVTLLLLEHPAERGSEAIGLGLVADGLGGHSNGQEASRSVARLLTDDIYTRVIAPYLQSAPGGGQATEGAGDSDGAGDRESDEEDETIRAALRAAVTTANTALCDHNRQRDSDMGSTLVAALCLGATAYIASAGDSRVYSFSRGVLRRLTTDHSLVEQFVAGGYITPEERYTHPRRNEIYRSLGSDPKLEPDITIQRLLPGMRLLLCSDGLWEMVRDDEIERILAESAHPQTAVARLVAQANTNGGEDNISAVLIEVSA